MVEEKNKRNEIKNNDEIKKDIKKKRMNKSFVKALSPNYFKTYATNALVDVTDVDLRINFSNEMSKNSDGNNVLVIENQVILTPQAAMLLLDQLSKAVYMFEIKNYKISNERLNMLKNYYDNISWYKQFDKINKSIIEDYDKRILTDIKNKHNVIKKNQSENE